MDFHEELRLFRERTTDAERFRALIILGSGQETTAALLMGTLQLEHVAFLLTESTGGFPQRVAKVLEGFSDLPPLATQPEQWLCPEGDHSAPLQVYEGVKQVYDVWRSAGIESSSIAVDVTGGMKPMSVGLEKAAHLLGLTTIYLESEYGPGPTPGTRRPISGTQRLVIPPDPYQVFGDLEAAEAKRLYAAHDYDDAQQRFAKLAKRVPSHPHYALHAQLAMAYSQWDNFNLKEAEDQLGGLITTYGTTLGKKALQRLHDQVELLQRIRPLCEDRPPPPQKRRQETMAPFAQRQVGRLKELPVATALLAVLYANALRRRDQNRLDLASLLLYRCLELMSQQRLATHNVHTDWSLDGMEELKAQFPSLSSPQRKIAMGQGYKILQTIGDPLGAGCDLERIRTGADSRNQSLTAHGFTFISEEDFYTFKEVVNEVQVIWCEVNNINWNNYLEAATFLDIDTIVN